MYVLQEREREREITHRMFVSLGRNRVATKSLLVLSSLATAGAFRAATATTAMRTHTQTSSMWTRISGKRNNVYQQSPRRLLEKTITTTTPPPPPTTTTTTTTTTALRGGGIGGIGPSVFNSIPFWRSQKIIVGANVLGFLLSLVTAKQYHVDLLGTGAFAAAAIPSVLAASAAAAAAAASPPQRILWSAVAVTTWSVKLASFLLYRCINKGGVDARLSEILTVPYYSAGFWTFSVVWGIVCSLPHTLGSASQLTGSPFFLKLGAVIAGTGLATETLADYQKTAFKNTGGTGFCNTGVWSLSQHPNWFGNLLLWTGVLIMNAPALVDPLPKVATAAAAAAVATTATTTTNSSKLSVMLKHVWRFRRVGLALLSPLFMWYLFNGQATGGILPESLEATRKKYGYGINPDYTKCMLSVTVVVPSPSTFYLGLGYFFFFHSTN